MLEITKPGINKGNLFAMFTGFYVASGFANFNLITFLIALMGTALIIAGGCTLNNFYDRDIDCLMERTQDRVLPRGRISPVFAFWYGVILSLGGLLILSIGLNILTGILGLIGLIVYLFIYTMWLKRTSTLNTVIGGICGAVPPLVGWAAVTGTLNTTAWALFLLLFLWQPAHFFSLALLKAEEYRAASIPMLPVIEGVTKTKKQIAIFAGLLIPASLLIGFIAPVSKLYFSFAIVLSLLYLGLAVYGFFINKYKQWARYMFVYSLIYLMGLLIILVVDVTIVELDKLQ